MLYGFLTEEQNAPYLPVNSKEKLNAGAAKWWARGFGTQHLSAKSFFLINFIEYPRDNDNKVYYFFFFCEKKRWYIVHTNYSSQFFYTKTQIILFSNLYQFQGSNPSASLIVETFFFGILKRYITSVNADILFSFRRGRWLKLKMRF